MSFILKTLSGEAFEKKIRDMSSRLDNKYNDEKLKKAFKTLQIERGKFAKFTKKQKIKELKYKLFLFTCNYAKFPKLLSSGKQAYDIVNKYLLEQKRQLDEAFAVLQISRRQFEKFHTKQQKIDYLRYVLVQFEFFYYENKKLIDLYNKAYGVIYNASLIQNHVNHYGLNSQGLIELDTPRIVKVDNNNAIKILRETIIEKNPKNSGVEPGFLGHYNEEIFLKFFEQYPDINDRLEKIKELFEKIKELKGSIIDALADFYKKQLSRRVVKLTYGNISEKGKVTPDIADLSRTSTMKNIKKKFGRLSHRAALEVYKDFKKCSLKEINLEALNEVLANDVARSLGIIVQEQHLLRNFHNGRQLQLLLEAKWVEGATLLQPLAGSRNNQNYHVEFAPKDLGVKYNSSNKIAHLPRYFALLVALGDRDKVGSKGQNLLVKLGELVGIDFGHAFPKNNTLIDTLRFDFTFDAPKYKNYSVFVNDARRSEIMEGILILARLKGETIDPKILRSYGKEFYRTIMAVKPHADEQVFDDYIRKFNTLMAEDKLRAKDYQELIDRVEKNKRRYLASRNALINRFYQFIHLPAELIDALQNFEKLWAASQGETHMLSPDKTVMLQHLRVKRNFVKDWHIKNEDDQPIVLKAEFSNRWQAAKALATLNDYGINSAVNIEQQGKFVALTVPRNQLQQVVNLVSEVDLQATYHPKEHKLKKFIDGLNVLKKQGLNIDTCAGQGDKILLTIDPGKNKHSAEIANFIAKGLQFCKCDINIKVDEVVGKVAATIPRRRFQRVNRFLTLFDACYKHYEKARDQLNALSQSILEKDGIHLHFILKLFYEHGKFKFHLMMRSSSAGQPVKEDFITDGDLLRAIAQLETMKLSALQVYQNYKGQKCQLSLEQEISNFSAFLQKKYKDVASPLQRFMSTNPTAQLCRYLRRWRYNRQRFSHTALKQLGEVLQKRKQLIKTWRAKERLSQDLQKFFQNTQENKTNKFGTYLEENGKLDSIIKSIREIQLTPALQAKHEQACDQEKITTMRSLNSESVTELKF